MSREDDLRMLREALELGTLDDDTKWAFDDMLDELGNGRQRELTDRQRAWVQGVLGEPEYENLASKNGTQAPRAVRHNHLERAECGPSCPAWTPPSLRVLPKRPPTRRIP